MMIIIIAITETLIGRTVPLLPIRRHGVLPKDAHTKHYYHYHYHHHRHIIFWEGII
jgi:hypothetical protein